MTIKKKTNKRIKFSHPLQYIYRLENSGYWVRFTKNSDINIIHQCFYASEYGSLAKALIAAKKWRNEEYKKLRLSCVRINNRLFKQWSDTNRFVITGLAWREQERNGYIESYLTAYSSKPADKKCIYRRRSIKKHGLEGAFKLIITELENMRTAKYPDDIKAQAFERVKAEFDAFSISNFY